jgi:hypothetical protein
VPDPRIQQLRGAALAYRTTGDPSRLEVLRQHGERKVAHALTMERLLPAGERGGYTAEVNAWLDGLPG